MSQTLTAERIRAAAIARGDIYTPAQEIMMKEHWRRRHLASVTFGIEMRGVSIMLESDWDRIAARIDRQRGTCDPVIDEFYAVHFSPMSTKWIHHHPLLDDVAKAFEACQIIMAGHFDFTRPQYRDRLKQAC